MSGSRSFTETLGRWRTPLALSALTILIYLLPFLAVRVPLGYLYLDTDVPLHVAEVERAACPQCFVRDVFFIGDDRPWSELRVFYPSLSWLGRATTLGPAAISAFWGLAATLIAVLGAYWTLRRLGCGEALSAAFSTIFIFGVQIFGGVFIGMLGGGYNTHTTAISLALVLFGIFVTMVADESTRIKSLWMIPIAAACMNIYLLVFPQLIILMAVYHLLYHTVPLRKLALVLVSCAFLVPIPIFEFLRILKLPVGQHLPDLRQVMPFMYVENWQYFAASFRRFLVPLLILAAAFAVRPKAERRMTPAQEVLLRTAVISSVFLVASIILEQFSANFVRYQFSTAMSQWLFLSLLYLAVLALQAWPSGRISRRAAIAAGWVIMVIFVSSAIFTFRAYRGWIQSGPSLRDRAALFDAIRMLPPADAIFLSDPNRLAIEIRGFAGRGVLVAEKDRGKFEINAAHFAEYAALYAAVQGLDFSRDVRQLKTLAHDHHADYIILGKPETPLDPADVVYRNADFAVIRP